MSEKLRSSHEANLPNFNAKEKTREIENRLEKEAEKATHDHKQSVEKIREKIEKEANSSESILKKQMDDNKQTSAPITYRLNLKSHSVKNTIKRVQSKLPPAQKAFSKVIHNQAIDAVSEVGGKTVARPSGLLYGGITSFIFSLVFLYLAKYYGYEYNFFIGILAFVIGFFLGLLIESLTSLFKKNR